MDEDNDLETTKINGDEFHLKESESLKNILNLRGYLIRKDFHPLGQIDGLNFYTFVYLLRTLTSKSKTRYFGVYLQKPAPFGAKPLDTHFYFEELDDCLSALRFLKNAAIEMAGEKTDYQEITFSSREGHRFGICHVSGVQKFYLELDGAEENIEIKEIDDLIGVFTAGKDYLAKIADV